MLILGHSDVCVCVCVCVRAPMCTVHVWVPFPLRCFSISPVRAGIAALLSILLELRTDRSPINLSSTNHVRRRGGTWEVWQRRTLGRGGRRGGETSGHSLITWTQAGTLCASVRLCVCVRQEKGQSLVTRW